MKLGIPDIISYIYYVIMREMKTIKLILEDLKDFKEWWGKDGTGVPVWFFVLTMIVFFIIGIIIIK